MWPTLEQPFLSEQRSIRPSPVFETTASHKAGSLLPISPMREGKDLLRKSSSDMQGRSSVADGRPEKVIGEHMASLRDTALPCSVIDSCWGCSRLTDLHQQAIISKHPQPIDSFRPFREPDQIVVQPGVIGTRQLKHQSDRFPTDLGVAVHCLLPDSVAP